MFTVAVILYEVDKTLNKYLLGIMVQVLNCAMRSQLLIGTLPKSMTNHSSRTTLHELYQQLGKTMGA